MFILKIIKNFFEFLLYSTALWLAGIAMGAAVWIPFFFIFLMLIKRVDK